VWSSFDQRRKAKANDTGNDVVDAAGEPDMFGGTGATQAAE